MGIYPVNAVANAIVWLSIGIQVSKGINPYDGVLACVAAIRESPERLKDPGFITAVAVDLAKIQSQVSWNNKSQDVATAEESFLIVNNI